MRDDIASRGINKKCALQGAGYGLCSGKIQWHHVWIYAGRQINEPWAIVGACESHHEEVGRGGIVLEAFQKVSLSRATDEDLRKYPKKDWKQIIQSFI